MSRALSPQERAVLQALMARCGEVVSRPALVDALYPPGVERPASALTNCDAVVTRLRKMGHRIFCRSGRGYWIEAAPLYPPVRLTPQAQVVLDLLVAEQGKVVSRDALADALYPPGADRPAGAMFSCDRVVSHLRRLTGLEIECFRGRGYRLLGAA